LVWRYSRCSTRSLRLSDSHFVLHDVFGVPFADIATTLDRSEAAAQQLASRPRRRLRNSPEPDRDLARQRRVVDAFLAASRGGDFDALLEVLDPHVELRIDGGALRADASLLLHGADAVAAHTTTYSKLYPFVRPALVNGVAGASGGAPRPRVLGDGLHHHHLDPEDGRSLAAVASDGARRAEPRAGECPQNGAFVRSRGAAPLRRWRRHSSDVRVDRLVCLHGCRRREAGC
jgi:hypothetical protein